MIWKHYRLSVKVFIYAHLLSDQNRHATTYCTNKVPCPKKQRKFIHKSINYAYKFTKKIIQINIKLFVYPRWTPADVTDTICGYPCQTAVADYLGRRWSVWYTTEIPVTAGPWLLWGLPGLVLQAVDQDRLFVFRAKEIGYAPADRSGHLEHLAERSKRLHSYPISRMEQTLNKVKSSYEAMDRMQGGSGFVIKANDDGTMEKFVPELKYIPLIPDEYWKKQDK